jgi:putative transposase
MRDSRKGNGGRDAQGRFTDQQIRYAVQEVEAGISVAEVCRKYGISEATFYRWRQRFGSLTRSELSRLKELERENARLKKLVAELTLDKQILQDLLARKGLRLARQREHVYRLVGSHGISERKACRALGWPRSTHRYRSVARDVTALRMRLKKLALARPRFGYQRLHILLCRKGYPVNHKRVLRLYREEGLTLRIPRKKRKVASCVRVPLPAPSREGYDTTPRAGSYLQPLSAAQGTRDPHGAHAMPEHAASPEFHLEARRDQSYRTA